MNVAVAPPSTLAHPQVDAQAGYLMNSLCPCGQCNASYSVLCGNCRLVLLVDLLFVAKKRILRANYRHGCPRYNDAVIAVN